MTVQKLFKGAVSSAIEGNTWKKFANPTVGLGLAAYPKNPSDQERIGVRFDYAGVTTGDDGKSNHKFKLHPSAGKIPSSFKDWRDSPAARIPLCRMCSLRQVPRRKKSKKP